MRRGQKESGGDPRLSIGGNKPPRERDRKMPFDDGGASTDWYYGDCFTIDPGRADIAWQKLNENRLGLEVGMIPSILHYALLDTLRERKSFARLGRKRA